MKVSKKILAMVLAGAVFCMTGCGMDVNLNISKSGTETIKSVVVYYTESEIREMTNDDGETVSEDEVNEILSTAKKTTINGTTYYYDVEDGTSSYENKANGNVTAAGGYYSSSTFELPLPDAAYDNAEAMEEYVDMFSGADFVKYKITFPYKVLAANGTISKDGYTVTYNISKLENQAKLNGFRIYASFTKAATTAKDITVSGVENGKTYSTNKKITVSSKGTITNLTLDGKTISGRSVTVTKAGKHTLYVKLKSGATKKVVFTIDKNQNRYKVTASALRVRKGASVRYKVLGKLKKGTAVTVLSKKGNWGKIKYNGKTGWVYMKYLKKC